MSFTDIFAAAQEGTVDDVKSFIDKGVDVNTKDKYGQTPLHIAVGRENIEIVKFLVSEGKANVNVKEVDGKTPLHLAATYNDNIEVVKFLIDNGADVNAKNNGGYTPLHSAVGGKNVELVRYLVLEGKADVEARDGHGGTPLHTAVRNGQSSEIIKFLVSEVKANVNAKDEDSSTPLHSVAMKQNIEFAKILISSGRADVNAKDKRNLTPLGFAVHNNNTELINIFNNAGTNENTKAKEYLSDDSGGSKSSSSIEKLLMKKSNTDSISGCLAIMVRILIFVFKANLGGRIGIIVGVIFLIINLVVSRGQHPIGNDIIMIFFLGIVGAVIGAIINFIIKPSATATQPVEKPASNKWLFITIFVALGVVAVALVLSLLPTGNNNPKSNNNSMPEVDIYKPFTDSRDGKTYKAVTIGNKTWMAENLNYDTEGGKCYNNNPENCEKYGRHYNWTAAIKACPVGWHLPSNAEWDALYRIADGTSGKERPYKSETAGGYLKAKSGWNSQNGKSGNGEDAYGFAALPGGSGRAGAFHLLGENGYWWSATENNKGGAYYRFMLYESDIAGWNSNSKDLLLSVRCLQD